MISLPPILTTTIGPVLSVAAVVTMWILVIQRLRLRRPSCGGCGGDVRSAGSMMCPHCGADLRSVGVMAARRREVHPALFLLLWSLLPIPAVLALSQVMLRHGPGIVNASWRTTATSRVSTLPALDISVDRSGSGEQVPRFSRRISTSWRMEGATVTRSTTTISLHPVPGLRVTQVTLRTPRGRLLTFEPVAAEDDLDDESARMLREWLYERAITDQRSPALREDVAEVRALIARIVTDRRTFTSERFKLSPGWSSAQRVAAQWFVKLIVVAWLLPWAGGVIAYLVLRRFSRGRYHGQLVPAAIVAPECSELINSGAADRGEEE